MRRFALSYFSGLLFAFGLSACQPLEIEPGLIADWSGTLRLEGREYDIELFIEFDSLRAFAGCNLIAGDLYALKGEWRFYNGYTSAMACSPELMAAEDQLVEALNTATAYRLEAGGRLVLLGGAGQADLLTFLPAP